MSSGCKSSSSTVGCVDARVPIRATYVNLYKWPESDAEFVKSVSSAGVRHSEQRRRPHRHHYQHPLVVDSYSCRQMYLRSYTFSKKETVPERTRKYLGKVKEKVPGCVPWGGGGGGAGSGAACDKDGSCVRRRKKKRCLVMRRLREVSSAALCSIFHRLLSCTSTVDVAGRQPS